MIRRGKSPLGKVGSAQLEDGKNTTSETRAPSGIQRSEEDPYTRESLGRDEKNLKDSEGKNVEELNEVPSRGGGRGEKKGEAQNSENLAARFRGAGLDRSEREGGLSLREERGDELKRGWERRDLRASATPLDSTARRMKTTRTGNKSRKARGIYSLNTWEVSDVGLFSEGPQD